MQQKIIDLKETMPVSKGPKTCGKSSEEMVASWHAYPGTLEDFVRENGLNLDSPRDLKILTDIVWGSFDRLPKEPLSELVPIRVCQLLTRYDSLPDVGKFWDGIADYFAQNGVDVKHPSVPAAVYMLYEDINAQGIFDSPLEQEFGTIIEPDTLEDVIEQAAQLHLALGSSSVVSQLFCSYLSVQDIGVGEGEATLKDYKKAIATLGLDTSDPEVLKGLYESYDEDAKDPSLTFEEFSKDLSKPQKVKAAPAGKPMVSAGNVFSITGELFKTRDEIVKMMEAKGYVFSPSITGKVDIVLVGEKPGSKLEKAEEKGITIKKIRSEKDLDDLEDIPR